MNFLCLIFLFSKLEEKSLVARLPTGESQLPESHTVNTPDMKQGGDVISERCETDEYNRNHLEEIEISSSIENEIDLTEVNAETTSSMSIREIRSKYFSSRSNSLNEDVGTPTRQEDSNSTDVSGRN
jgi:hypothetical protein